VLPLRAETDLSQSFAKKPSENPNSKTNEKNKTTKKSYVKKKITLFSQHTPRAHGKPKVFLKTTSSRL